MKKYQFVTILILMLLITGVGQSQEVATLSGQATLLSDGSPAQNLALKLTKADQPNHFAFTTTDENGNYFFDVFHYPRTILKKKLVPGKYILTNVDTFSYDPIEINDIELVAGENILNFTTNRRGGDATINGYVSFNNQGKADVDVYFIRLIEFGSSLKKVDQTNPPNLNDAAYTVTTDQNGDFSLDVISGKYIVYIPGTDEYLPYYSDFRDPISAIADQIKTIQIELLPNTLLSISGTVANFESFDDVYVAALSVNRLGGFPVIKVLEKNGNGIYTLYVKPGEFIISCVGLKSGNIVTLFYNKDKGQVSSPEEATIVNITESMSDVDFTFPPDLDLAKITITGKVTDEITGLPIEGADVGFLSTNTNSFGQSQNGNYHRNFSLRTVKTGQDGTYTWESTTLLETVSLLGYSYMDDYFIEFYDNQPTFFTATMIEATADEPVPNINFSLMPINTQNTYSISGTVMGDDGNPVTYGSVIAYSTYGKKYVTVKEDGSFIMEGFPEGTNVILQAWGIPGYIPEFYDNQYSILKADILEMTENKTGIDFELAKRNYNNAVGRIGGRIVGNGNLSKQSLNKSKLSDDPSGVTLYIKPEGDSEWFAANYSDATGQYELPIEGYGQYEIMTTAPGYEDNFFTISINSSDINSSLFKDDFNISLISTDIEDEVDNVVRQHKLYNAYPNPFNPTTTINIDIASPEEMTLTIYNVLGQKERTIYSGIIQPGSHSFIWDGKDDLGNTLSSGLYFYQWKTSKIQETKAVVFMK